MSISALLQAAEYLERRSRETEHCYASVMPMQIEISHEELPTKARSFHGNRLYHNELEKNRRRYFRDCLEKLKELVPYGPQSSRHTTLGLLIRTKEFIKILEDKDKKDKEQIRILLEQHRRLQRRLNELGLYTDVIMSKKRKISECSAGMSVCTNSSTEFDDLDVGYSSNPSDTEDHSSIHSLTSDSGVVMST